MLSSTLSQAVHRRFLHRSLSTALAISTVASAILAGHPAGASANPARALGAGTSPVVTTQATAQAAYGKLGTSFVENAGQIDSAVRFAISSSAGSIFFTAGGLTLSLPLPSANPTPASASASTHTLPGRVSPEQQVAANQTAVAIKLNFIGANPGAAIEGTNVLPGSANYFIGSDKTKWVTDVRTYGGVAYRNLYPGIDLTYAGHGGTLKGTYTVAPGADPTQIRWQYAGADSAAIDGQGNLAIKASSANLTEQLPQVWQVRADGSQSPVTASYQVDSKGIAHFAFGAYDHAQPLIVDPGLVYSTYLGGSGNDQALGIALDSAGEAYITGYTNSTNFPTTSGVYQIGNGGGDDAFITKLNTAGTAIVYSTFVGGSNADVANAIAVDQDGYAYITGDTFSTNFPTTSGAFQTSLHGTSYNAFVTKLRPAGDSLFYSTYLGGSSGDAGFGIAVDSNFSAYVTGYTYSPDFPTTSGAFQTAFQPDGSYTVNSDGFVTKLNELGTALTYSTYLGYSGSTGDYGIAVDGGGDAYVTGFTSGPIYWYTPGSAYQSAYGGGNSDALMTEVNPAGSMLVNSTYLGGAGSDWGNSIALDSAGYVYVTGPTTGSFPTTASAFQTSVSNANTQHGFVTEFYPPGGSASAFLYYSTYLGGSGDDVSTGIAVDRFYQAHVTGYTSSSNFPTTGGAFQPLLLGSDNAFATVISGSGNGLIHSTYLGGSSGDYGNSVATDYSGDTYVAGAASSTNFPLAYPIQNSNHGGNFDAFVTKLDTLVGRIDSIGVYRGGVFYLRLHNNFGYADFTVTFNPAGNNAPVVGDWVNNGFDAVGVFDRNSAKFTLCKLNDTTACGLVGNQITFNLGNANDAPMAGRWQIGTSHAGAGVYRPTNGILYLKNVLSTGYADNGMVMGLPGDDVVAGDWTGKGFDSPGIYRPSVTAFFLSNQVTSGVVYADISATYGNSTDLPIVGDWIAQSHDGIGMFRPTNGFVYLRNTITTGYADNRFFYGQAGDQPVAGHWQYSYPPAPPMAHPAGPPTIIVPHTPAPSNNGGGIVPGGNQIGG